MGAGAPTGGARPHTRAPSGSCGHEHRAKGDDVRRTRTTMGALAVTAGAAAAMLLPTTAVGAPPVVQVVDAGPAVSGLSDADAIAGTLLGPGVSLSGPASINGTAVSGSYAAALPSFGRFTAGETEIGISDGLVIGANARAGSFATGSYQDVIAADRDDSDLFDVVNAAGLCGVATAASCTNNATSIEFAVQPTERYLKFEYALGITEVGSWNGSAWSGDVFSYPDGFALFVGGRQVSDNCAVLPRTSTYVTMQTAGIVAQATSGTNRALAQANLDARIADTASPPVTPNGFAYSAQNPQWAVKFTTLPLTCVADVNADLVAGTPTDMKIVVADVNDSAVPPAVFLKGGSVRFSATPTPSPAIDTPAVPTPLNPPPATPPVAPPPAPATSPPATPLAPPTTRTPTAGAATGERVLTYRLQLNAAGRYTFIYVNTRTGTRIPQLRGSRIGKRNLTGRYSAPVLQNQIPGRRLVLSSRLDSLRLPKAGSGVALRIVHRAPDGTLSEVTMDAEGRLS